METIEIAWLKPMLILQILPDGTRKWLERSDGGWILVKEEDAPATADHSHATHGDINFTGTVSVGGEAGLSGSKVLDGKRLTFTNGILTGYEVV